MTDIYSIFTYLTGNKMLYLEDSKLMAKGIRGNVAIYDQHYLYYWVHNKMNCFNIEKDELLKAIERYNKLMSIV